MIAFINDLMNKITSSYNDIDIATDVDIFTDADMLHADIIIEESSISKKYIKESKEFALNMHSNIFLCDDTTYIIGIECIICMEEFTVNDKIRRLNCTDYYHKKCIDEWLINRKMSCPHCQCDIVNMISN